MNKVYYGTETEAADCQLTETTVADAVRKLIQEAHDCDLIAANNLTIGKWKQVDKPKYFEGIWLEDILEYLDDNYSMSAQQATEPTKEMYELEKEFHQKLMELYTVRDCDLERWIIVDITRLDNTHYQIKYDDKIEILEITT